MLSGKSAVIKNERGFIKKGEIKNPSHNRKILIPFNNEYFVMAELFQIFIDHSMVSVPSLSMSPAVKILYFRNALELEGSEMLWSLRTPSVPRDP
jgi:hypothetical protein